MKKKIIIISIISFVIGLCVAGSICIVIAAVYNASDISYSPINNAWNVSNVQEAINDLYENSNVTATGSINIQSTAEQIINVGFRPSKVIIMIPSSSAGFWINITYDSQYTGNNSRECNLRSGKGGCGDFSDTYFSTTSNGFKYKVPGSNYYGNTYWYAIK